MKFIAENFMDIHRLANWYSQDRITADEYYAAVEEYAKVAVEEEVRHLRKMHKK